MERILNYTLTPGGVLPNTPLLAGYQGEHRATALVIDPDKELSDMIERAKDGYEVSCKIDAVNLSGEFIVGEKRAIDQIGEPFYLTSQMTALGLDTVILVRIILKNETETKEIYKAQIKLYFEPSAIPPVIIPDKQCRAEDLEQKAEEICGLIEERAQRVQEIMDLKLEAVSEKAQTSANHLKMTKNALEQAEEYALLAKESQENAKQSAVLSEESKNEAKTLILAAENYKSSALLSAQKASESALKTEDFSKNAENCLQLTNEALIEVKLSAQNAAEFAQNAKESENNAKESETIALKTKSEITEFAKDFKEEFTGLIEDRVNPLKGKADGSGVLLTDVSPVEHTVSVRLNSDTVTDFSSKKVTVQGKNLFSGKDFIAYTNSGIGSYGKENDTYLGEECFSFSQYKETEAPNFTKIKFKANTQYTFSVEYAIYFLQYQSYSVPCMRVYYTDNTYSDLSTLVYNSKYTKLVFTTPAGKSVRDITLAKFGKGVMVYLKKNAQIEEGVVDSEFEEYIEPKEYYANQNGVVEGVRSLSPNMNLLADDQTNLSVTYNRDINKVIENLTSAIISLGGNV